MAAPFTTTTQVAGPVNVVFQNRLLRVARARCINFVGSTAATIEEHSGSFTAKWRRFDALTPVTSALSELTGNLAFPVRDSVQPSVTDITKAVSKYGNYIMLSEEVDLINPSNHEMGYADTLGINAGRSLNRLQRNELEDNATVIYGTSGASADGSVTTKVTLANLKNAVNAIENQVAEKFTPMATGSQNFNTTPVRDSYWALTHVDVEQDIRDISGFASVETYAGHTQTAPGEYGSLPSVGVRFLSSSEQTVDADSGGSLGSTGLRSTSGSSIDLYNVVVFGRDFHGSLGLGTEHVKEVYKAGDDLPPVMVINHGRGSSGVADPLNEVSTMGWKSWHAAKILNSNWGRRIRVGATDLAA